MFRLDGKMFFDNGKRPLIHRTKTESKINVKNFVSDTVARVKDAAINFVASTFAAPALAYA